MSSSTNKYEFGLELEELEKRTNPEFITTKVLLKSDAPEYLSLQEGDKEALKYLVKAGAILEMSSLIITPTKWLFPESLEPTIEMIISSPSNVLSGRILWHDGHKFLLQVKHVKKILLAVALLNSLHSSHITFDKSIF